MYQTENSSNVKMPANFPWMDKPKSCEEAIWRETRNPIINRNPVKNVKRIYNSAVIPFEDHYIAVLRADYKNGMPFLHLGESEDGLNWNISDKKLLFSTTDGIPGMDEYAYDPRVTYIDGKYYITWCNGYGGPTIGVAGTTDFKNIEQYENAFLPFNRNGVLLPKKINGNFAMLSRPSDNGHTPFGDIYYSESPDMCFWGKHRHVLSPTETWWECTKVGAGPTPIETSQGWLLFYHGVMSTCSGLVYSMGATLLDLEKPWIVIGRTKEALLTPETDYETIGHVPNVIFPCASLYDEPTGRIAIYYGAADTTTCLAYTTCEKIINEIAKSAPSV